MTSERSVCNPDTYYDTKIYFNYVDVKAEILRNWSVFDDKTWRQDAEGSCHKDTKTIYLRSPRLREEEEEEYTESIVHNRIETETEYTYELFPKTVAAVNHLISRIETVELGRVMIVALAPGGYISPHTDQGDYPEHYDRYHMCISVPEELVFTIGENRMKTAPGSTYWINNDTYEHSVDNTKSDEWRISIIVDIKGWL